MGISVNTLSTKSNILNQSLCKILNLTVVSLSLQAILVPLVVMGNSAVVKADEFKPKQLIAQSCRRNIDVRVTNGKSRTMNRGKSALICDYMLNLQRDGNLVLTNRSGQVLWATGTEGRGELLSLQSDGNLVLYGGGRALWATNTDGNPGAFFAIQGDGNLVIYRSDGRQALWASNTDGGQSRTRNAAGEWSGGGQSPVQVSQPSQNSSQPNAPLTSLNPAVSDCHLGGACYFRKSNPSVKHTGVDYFINAGSNVSAICDGVVQLSQTNSNDSWNSFLIIRHNNCGGYESIYAYYGHLDSQVSNGQSVKKGQTVGTIQNNGGNSHLHLGLATVYFSGDWGYQYGNLSANGWIDPDDFARKY
jgi:Peptidase family M23